MTLYFFFFSSRRRHTRFKCDWSSDVCSSDLTSHALVQDRVGACDFDVATFTNVGHDHMDYHATWEDYLEAKARLIDLAAGGADKGIEKTAVLNRDDPSYERLSGRSISRRWSYG